MDHFTYRTGELYAEEVSIKAIAEANGTPFYCYSTATLVRHYRIFKESLASLNPLICYAAKANDSLAVVRTLVQEGSGVDAVSGGEIHIALKAGADPQKIVFSGVGKTESEIEYAITQGIFQFNTESPAEIHAISQVAERLNKTANIAIRVNPDVDAGTHAKIATGHKESKFGIPIEQALGLYHIAASLPNLNIQGVSVHIGSQLTTLAPFAKAFARVTRLVHELRKEGHMITTLDLGGGLGIPYDSNQSEPPLPHAYAEMVKEHTQGVNCQLIFEPGRLIVGNAGILVTKVLYLKHASDRVFVIVDAGMNDLMRPALYDSYHDIIPVRVQENAKTELVDVVGPVCESSDIFAEKRLLKLPAQGDLLAMRSAGAYGASMASTYNARSLPMEIMVRGKEFFVIRERETYEDLTRRDRIPAWL